MALGIACHHQRQCQRQRKTINFPRSQFPVKINGELAVVVIRLLLLPRTYNIYTKPYVYFIEIIIIIAETIGADVDSISSNVIRCIVWSIRFAIHIDNQTRREQIMIYSGHCSMANKTYYRTSGVNRCTFDSSEWYCDLADS